MTATQGPGEGARAKTLDRRQLLKAGAWAAPVVVLAAATPAASASGTMRIEFTHLSTWYLWTGAAKTGLAATTCVQGIGDTGASTTGITLVVTTLAAGMSTAAPKIVTGADKWVTRQAAIVGQYIFYVFRFAGTLQAGFNTGELKFELAGSGNLPEPPPTKVLSIYARSDDGLSDFRSASALRATNPSEDLPPIPIL